MRTRDPYDQGGIEYVWIALLLLGIFITVALIDRHARRDAVPVRASQHEMVIGAGTHDARARWTTS